MAFDANLVLRDGSVDLDNSEAVSTSITANADGAKCIDLGTTVRTRGDSEGIIHLTASLILPTAPTTYADTLAVVIQQSDNLGFGWETLASFPTLYTYTRLLSVKVVTAFAAGDIGKVLTGATTGDTGEIRWMHPDLLTVGKTANMIITMQAAGDVFDDDDEVVDAAAGTGDGTMNGIAVVEDKPRLGGSNTHIRAFGVTKRYLRGQLTASAGSNFGKAHLLLSPYRFRK